jgi:hypothetical protein
MGYGKNRTQISKWAGFDAQDREICRIADGTINEGYASVISVRYEDNYNYGMVVFVDHKPESEEEQKLPTYPPRMVAKERHAEVAASFHKAAETVGDVGDTGPRFGSRFSDGYSKATFSKPADSVKKDLPPVLTREEFDAKPESYRNEYVSIIMDLIMVMQVSLLNGLMSKVDPKFIEFIKNILGSDIVKSEWTDVFFVDGRPHENVPVPTLLAFTMNKFNVPLSLQKELFGDFRIFLTKEEKDVEEPMTEKSNVKPTDEALSLVGGALGTNGSIAGEKAPPKSRPRTTRTKNAAVVVKPEALTSASSRKKPRKPEVKQ